MIVLQMTCATRVFLRAVYKIEFHRIIAVIIQQIVTLSKYGHDALSTVFNIYPAIYVVSCARGKMFKAVLEIKVEEYFFSCVINLLNNKTIILLSIRRYSARFRRIIV